MKIPLTIRALLWLPIRGNRLPVLPLRGIQFLFVATAFLCVALLLAEFAASKLSSDGVLPSAQWERDRDLLWGEKLRRSPIEQPAPPSRLIWPGPPSQPVGTLPPPQRILVIGDSFPWGDGLMNANTAWWRELQRELEARGYWNIEVISVGEPGQSTSDFLRWIRYGLLEATRPDLVIIGYVTNDADLSRYRQINIQKQLLVSEKTDAVIARWLPTIYWNLQALRQTTESQRLSGPHFGYAYDKWETMLLSPENLADYSRVLQQLQSELVRYGKPAFAVTLPNRPDPNVFEPHYRKIRPLFQESGIELLDLLPEFIKQYGTDKRVATWAASPVNGHPGPRATRFFAVQVASHLQANYLSPLGTSKTALTTPTEINDWLPVSANVTQVGPSSWKFDYPATDEHLFVMPVGTPHAILSLARPIRFASVILESNTPSEYQLWVTTIDPSDGSARLAYEYVGKAGGRQGRFNLPHPLKDALISSFRISRSDLPNGPRRLPDAPIPISLTITIE